MIEAALVIISLAQAGLLWYVLNSQKDERAKLINALVSKNPQEMAQLEVIDKQKPEKSTKVEENDLRPLSQLSDKEFDKYVLGK